MTCILVVDDEIIGRDMLSENLQLEGYQVVEAESGAAAWRALTQRPEAFDAILLDRMLPDMDGIDILLRLKANEETRHLPVIMQTGMTADADILAGLQAGAYYYLTKPYAPETLLAIVAAATRDYRGHRELVEEVSRQGRSLSCLMEARFAFRTLEEARNLAAMTAHAAPQPGRVVLGLSELMINAIEHGNLRIGYEEKSRLINEGRLAEVVEQRLAEPAFAGCQAELLISRRDGWLSYTVRDQGPGFDWQRYLEMSPERAFDTHGRGIALSRQVSFDRLAYVGCGNEVCASVRLDP